ncbi:MAG: MFS transporter, partial [Myxococcota bacterium]|nr:MFS transporter [Myxococcota bacterium]
MSERALAAEPRRLLSAGFTSLLIANVGFGYAFSTFFLLPKFLAVELGAGPGAVGGLTAAHGAVVVLALPLMGAAVDRLGRRVFLMVGALVMAAASGAYAGVDELGALLYGLRLVQGLAFAMVFAAGGALAVDLAPPERLGQAIGMYGLSFLAMNAVAPAVVEQVSLQAGWGVAFGTAGVGALLCAALSLRIPEPASDPDGAGNGSTLLEVARYPGRIVSLLVIALVGSALSAVFAFHQLFALELGIEQVSSFFVAYSCSAVFVRAVLGHLMDRWGNRRAALAALLLYVAVVLAVVQLDMLGLVVLGAGLGIAHGVFYPAFNASVVAEAGAGERGRLMALFQAAFQVGMAGGGLGYGLLAEVAGYPAVFAAAAAGLVV